MRDRSILMAWVCVVGALIPLWVGDYIISSVWMAALVVIYANSEKE